MLGYIISSEGIKANLDKTRAIMTMEEPKNKKEVQKLTLLPSPEGRRQLQVGAQAVGSIS